MSLRKFQNGEKVVLTDKMPVYLANTFGLKPGDEVTVYNKSYESNYYIEFMHGGTLRRHEVRSNALSKIVPKSKREQFLDQIEKAKEKIQATNAFIAETESKIKFMDETGVEDFDENEFKAYHTLLIIDKSNMTTVEKAKAIAKLISSK
jgi:bifunctional DNA-binding transcriptional regulator/antitoxin component of YhaV-PrlF toxin-antitoxin module